MDSIRVSEAPDPSSILGETTQSYRDSRSVSDRKVKNMLMFFAYVVKSAHNDFLYKGHCENLEERIRQHNAGMTQSLRPYIPVELIYFEEFVTRGRSNTKRKIF